MPGRTWGQGNSHVSMSAGMSHHSLQALGSLETRQRTRNKKILSKYAVIGTAVRSVLAAGKDSDVEIE